MRTIVNIPYLTSGRQITHTIGETEKNEKKEPNQLYRNEMEQKILERKQTFLKLSDGFRSAFNYNFQTCSEKST